MEKNAVIVDRLRSTGVIVFVKPGELPRFEDSRRVETSVYGECSVFGTGPSFRARLMEDPLFQTQRDLA